MRRTRKRPWGASRIERARCLPTGAPEARGEGGIEARPSSGSRANSSTFENTPMSLSAESWDTATNAYFLPASENLKAAGFHASAISNRPSSISQKRPVSAVY